jgi:hypothetical protein
MWVVDLEVLITCMCMFPVHFHGQFTTPLHDQDGQEQKSIISFNFHCEVVKKLLQSCWSMWPNHESVINVSEPFSEWSAVYMATGKSLSPVVSNIFMKHRK